MQYPALCTGCNMFVYEDEQSGPCPNCFPGMTREERDADRAAMEDIVLDFFAFEAAVRTERP